MLDVPGDRNAALHHPHGRIEVAQIDFRLRAKSGGEDRVVLAGERRQYAMLRRFVIVENLAYQWPALDRFADP